MKKKVLPQFHHSYSTLELSLIASVKSYFVNLKQQKLTIVPFGFSVQKKQSPEEILPPILLEDSQLNFIEILVDQGSQLVKNKEASCFAVAYDAFVFDADNRDEEALAIMLFKEDGEKVRINVPYIMSEDDIVFGEDWLT